eukprot:s1977_g3.t1
MVKTWESDLETKLQRTCGNVDGGSCLDGDFGLNRASSARNCLALEEPSTQPVLDGAPSKVSVKRSRFGCTAALL